MTTKKLILWLTIKMGGFGWRTSELLCYRYPQQLNRNGHRLDVIAILIVLAVCIWGCEQPGEPGPITPAVSVDEMATYVGGKSCVACHADQSDAWHESHHDLSMQAADAATVLGDFSNAEFTYNEVTSAFFQRGMEYWVRTDGLNGDIEEYQITHTFGVEPLQQYLVESAGGRRQALSIAWDSRPEHEGGQRWFHLYPSERVDHTDPLHWSGTFQNWNGTCAECHSTNLRKNFVLETDSYDTTFSSIDVDCEACHGPGSLHVVAPQEAPLQLGRDQSAQWLFSDEAVTAHRMPPLPDRRELETCAQCHSRRTQFGDEFEPGDAFLDGFRPALLDSTLYHADGQIQDEVYVYGSFLQSKMHAAGVSCSDCHDPHSTRLRLEGNGLCGQCHLENRYDDFEHHRHEVGLPGSYCVDCHMPATTYMVIDPRRDHSFRVPRPDLSLELEAPNACNLCHENESVGWASAAVAAWFPQGRSRMAHYGQALRAGRTWAANGGDALRATVADAAIPSIVRATAVNLLSRQVDDSTWGTIEQVLRGDDHLVQLAAIEALQNVSHEVRVKGAQPFLRHPRRALRMAAARVLLPARASLNEQGRDGLSAALAEYSEAQRFNSDRAEGLFNVGSVLFELGRAAEAQAVFGRVIEGTPTFIGAYINLADIHRTKGAETEARAVLERAVARNPQDAAGHFALGLSLVRAGSYDAAFVQLELAAKLSPDTPYYLYVIGIALHSNGERGRALAQLGRVHRRFPGHRDTLIALSTIHRDGGELELAAVYARRLLAVSPGDATARSLMEETMATPP